MSINALIVGGHSGCHAQRIYPHLSPLGIYPKWHWDYQDSTGTKTFPRTADLVIVFVDMVGHQMEQRVLRDAKAHSVPLIRTSRRKTDFIPKLKEVAKLLRATKGGSPAQATMLRAWKDYTFVLEGGGWTVREGETTLVSGFDLAKDCLRWAKQHNKGKSMSITTKPTGEAARVYRRLGGQTPPAVNKNGFPLSPDKDVAIKASLLLRPNLTHKEVTRQVAKIFEATGHSGPFPTHHSGFNTRSAKEALGIFSRGHTTCLDRGPFVAAREEVGLAPPTKLPLNTKWASEDDLLWRKTATKGGRPKKSGRTMRLVASTKEGTLPSTPPQNVIPSEWTPLVDEGRRLLSTDAVQFVLGRSLTDDEVLALLLKAGLKALKGQ